MKKITLLILCSLFFNGACSFLMPTRSTVTIDTAPPDAFIKVDGDYVGRGHAQAKIKNRGGKIEVNAKGYETTVVSPSYHLAPIGFVDIAGTLLFFLPIAGLFSDGAYAPDQKGFQIELEPKADAPAQD